MHPHLCGERRESPCFPKIERRERVQPEDSRLFWVFVFYSIRGSVFRLLGTLAGESPTKLRKANLAVVNANTA